VQKLFKAMAKRPQEGGGRLDFRRIEWFNGGIFDDDSALPLKKEDIKVALAAANRNWSNIDPSIMGTLFERGLDPGKRSQLGAHYTDPDKIMLIVTPVIVEPLTREWEEVRSKIEAELETATAAREARPKTQKEAAAFFRTQRQREENAIRRAQRHFQSFQTRLREFRVLDPACGSGNFLYLALKALKDIELRANQEWERLARSRGLAIGVSAPLVGPENMLGIEINPFAAELARVSVWIGEIQWMREHGLDVSRDPILKPLQAIKRRDALLNEDGTEAEWPEADVIVGNPPFLGRVYFLDVLGEIYTQDLRRTFSDRLPGDSDLVCFWFAKSLDALIEGKAVRVGLVATNSIRGGANNVSLRRIVEHGQIFSAWSDEPWVVEGASVRVSIVCFDLEDTGAASLNGQGVVDVFPDLTASVDLSRASRLFECDATSFIGDQKTGAFDVDGDLARQWLSLPLNPNGRHNHDVLRPWANGMDVTRRSSGRWIIDFGTNMPVAEAALYEAPFAHISESVRGIREGLRESRADRLWWLHQRPRPEMRAAITQLSRYLASPRVAKYRLFVWIAPQVLPDCQLVVVARDDDTAFGILQSRFHECGRCAWAPPLKIARATRPQPASRPSPSPRA
jgi:type II restriction/modification system DNA methylase subunit YeeA